MADNPRAFRGGQFGATRATPSEALTKSAAPPAASETAAQPQAPPPPPPQSAQSAPLSADVEISTTNFSDAPAQRDSLGFAPYVRAVAWFLIDPQTSPPLTFSIEGRWGSGKSSFMLQLADRLKVLAGQRNDVGEVRCVWFNPWKNDKDEALWASFALALCRQLERGTPPLRRALARLRLFSVRVEWSKLMLPAISLVLFGGLTALIWLAPDVRSIVLRWAPQSAKYAPVLVTALAALGSAAATARHLIGDPLPKSLAGYVRKPQLGDRVPLIERFSREFSDTVNAFVGKNGRVFVFIDDLDRCEVPRAAELMQAINLLMTSDMQHDFEGGPTPSSPSNLIFVLGIDREMVAAGIAAKNKRVLPYLASRDDGPAVPDPKKYGIKFGYEFLEKFIQTPFHVPRVRREGLEPWIKGLVGVSAVVPNPASPAPGADRGALLAGRDPERFEDIVLAVSAAFRFGPRRIKQFVNVLRLQIAIAIQTGQLVRAPAEATGSGIPFGLTLERLALVTAILLEWPSAVGKVFENPSMLAMTPTADGDFPDLAQIIQFLGPAYSLIGLDVTALVEVMPDAYPDASLGRGGRQRTRLAASSMDPDLTIPASNATPSPSPPPPPPPGPASAPSGAVAPE